MSVGANIKKRRYELKMSQQELADALGYKTRSTIAKIESGENDVSHRKLQRFAAALHTTEEALISGYAAVSEEASETISPKQTGSIVILLAGGKSGRNRQNIPSQFINVNGKPIIVYCMETYQSHPAVEGIYVVCLKGWENIVKAYANQYGISKLKGIITGANSGITSLKNGYDYVKRIYGDDKTVIIQESTRPLVSAETVSKLLQVCSEKGSATICHHMNDYVQFDISSGSPRYVDRNTTIALQSPEAHSLSVMRRVFEKAEAEHHPLTESCCTMLLYNLGFEINFIESSVNNIKITREEDLAAFASLMKE